MFLTGQIPAGDMNSPSRIDVPVHIPTLYERLRVANARTEAAVFVRFASVPKDIIVGRPL
jgi:hypothetical protein